MVFHRQESENFSIYDYSVGAPSYLDLDQKSFRRHMKKLESVNSTGFAANRNISLYMFRNQISAMSIYCDQEKNIGEKREHEDEDDAISEISEEDQTDIILGSITRMFPDKPVLVVDVETTTAAVNDIKLEARNNREMARKQHAHQHLLKASQVKPSSAPTKENVPVANIKEEKKRKGGRLSGWFANVFQKKSKKRPNNGLFTHSLQAPPTTSRRPPLLKTESALRRASF